MGVPGKPDYVLGGETCPSGKRQSPVNIQIKPPVSKVEIKVEMSTLRLTYEKSKSWTMFETFNNLEVDDIDTISSEYAATSSAGNGITMDTYGYTMSGEFAAVFRQRRCSNAPC